MNAGNAILIGALSMVVIAACASGPPRDTVASLTRARTLVAEAERSGAQQYDPTDLQAARDESSDAERLAAKGSDTQADEFANEAAVDAQLASARTANDKAQRDLVDLNRTLDTLRREELHGSGEPTEAPSTAPPAPPAPPSEGTQP